MTDAEKLKLALLLLPDAQRRRFEELLKWLEQRDKERKKR